MTVYSTATEVSLRCIEESLEGNLIANLEHVRDRIAGKETSCLLTVREVG